MTQLLPMNITIGSNEYRIGRLDLFDAMHVTKAVMPFMSVVLSDCAKKVMTLFAQSKDETEASVAEKLLEYAELAKSLDPVLYRLQLMDDELFDKIVKTCLSCVERRTGRTWGQLVVNGQLMFADLDQQAAWLLVAHVIGREVLPTLSELPKSAGGSL
jgi:hypothetical protein